MSYSSNKYLGSTGNYQYLTNPLREDLDCSGKDITNANVIDVNSEYQIVSNPVLNITTLGPTVVNSSLTKVAELQGLTVHGDITIKDDTGTVVHLNINTTTGTITGGTMAADDMTVNNLLTVNTINSDSINNITTPSSTITTNYLHVNTGSTLIGTTIRGNVNWKDTGDTTVLASFVESLNKFIMENLEVNSVSTFTGTVQINAVLNVSNSTSTFTSTNKGAGDWTKAAIHNICQSDSGVGLEDISSTPIFNCTKFGIGGVKNNVSAGFTIADRAGVIDTLADFRLWLTSNVMASNNFGLEPDVQSTRWYLDNSNRPIQSQSSGFEVVGDNTGSTDWLTVPCIAKTGEPTSATDSTIVPVLKIQRPSRTTPNKNAISAGFSIGDWVGLAAGYPKLNLSLISKADGSTSLGEVPNVVATSWYINPGDELPETAFSNRVLISGVNSNPLLHVSGQGTMAKFEQTGSTLPALELTTTDVTGAVPILRIKENANTLFEMTSDGVSDFYSDLGVQGAIIGNSTLSVTADITEIAGPGGAGTNLECSQRALDVFCTRSSSGFTIASFYSNYLSPNTETHSFYTGGNMDIKGTYGIKGTGEVLSATNLGTSVVTANLATVNSNLITSSTNLQIGSATPGTYHIDLVSSGAQTKLWSHSDSKTYLQTSGDIAIIPAGIGSTTGAAIYVQNTTNYVGINKDDAVANLDVYGTAIFERDDTPANIVKINHTAIPLECYLKDNVTTNKVATFHSDVTATNTEHCFIQANGDIKNTNNSYGAISDRTLKENIESAHSQWEDIKNIEVVNFNLKKDPTTTLLGVIAQQAEEVCPGLVEEVMYEGELKKSLKYSILYMKSVKALQEALIRIEQLEQKVMELETPKQTRSQLWAEYKQKVPIEKRTLSWKTSSVAKLKEQLQ